MRAIRQTVRLTFLIFSLLLGKKLNAQTNAVAKSITVPALSTSVLHAADIPLLFKNLNVTYNNLDQVNWDTYPYKPTVQFAIAYTEKAIYLHYRVQEQHIKAITTQDNGKVFEDACVEFFVQPNPNDLTYYNFEFNCIGTLLMQAGKPGKRSIASPVILNSIKRWSSLGKRPIDIQDQTTPWELAIIIPLKAFYLSPIDSLSHQNFKGNFYKCGDKLKQPHYLSWSPIHSPRPQFHALDFFGDIHFE